MSQPFDPRAAASLLVKADREGRQLTELPADVRPNTLMEGYAVQAAYAEALGETPKGWKLGVGSVAAMAAGNLERPLVGRLFAERFHPPGSTVRLPCAAPVTVEFEIAFVLGRDIAPGTAPADAMGAVASTHVAFELVQSRFVDRRAVGWPSFVGDNVGFGAHILGERIDPAHIDRVVKTVEEQADGRAVGRGLSGDDAIDPVQALRFLFERASYHGITLKRGDVVTTGAVAKPFDVGPGSVDVAALYLGGKLAVRVTTPQG
ncbi:hypothetical protein CAL29_04815 [Bordetella genomosp. 10]|uniref:Fumarylacetoacetase-like C-terminal domain-containing protein n=1 Tax=Bordetella genomosp. 10 TaxID=1416804 RepID=A0A261SL94_9BORD|nr:fumarylacetoacetate hydrolase family protein [Bordetella genomosp. 10]OZI37712.1 hypothetical protein CAL29_04815 [Bordetella genomosp. 10]